MNQVEKGGKISFPLPPPPFLSFSSRLTYSTMCHVRHAGDDKKTLKNDLEHDDVLLLIRRGALYTRQNRPTIQLFHFMGTVFADYIFRLRHGGRVEAD